jgi:predicted RNA-binding protein with PUA-like domain
MAYWLVKQEPSAFSWADFTRDGKAIWDGVRNYQARNNLAAMGKGEFVLFYHSVEGKEVMGIAKVARTAFPDPTDEKWVAVELKPVAPLKTPVKLEAIKAEPKLAGIALLRQSRLSVMPLAEDEFMTLVRMGGLTEKELK